MPMQCPLMIGNHLSVGLIIGVSSEKKMNEYVGQRKITIVLRFRMAEKYHRGKKVQFIPSLFSAVGDLACGIVLIMVINIDDRWIDR